MFTLYSGCIFQFLVLLYVFKDAGGSAIEIMIPMELTVLVVEYLLEGEGRCAINDVANVLKGTVCSRCTCLSLLSWLALICSFKKIHHSRGSGSFGCCRFDMY